MSHRTLCVLWVAAVAAVLCLGCSTNDDMDLTDSGTADGGGGEDGASGTATVSVTGSTECNGMIDASTGDPAVVGQATSDSNAVTLALSSDAVSLAASLVPTETLGGPPEGSGYTYDASQVGLEALQLACRMNDFVTSNDSGGTAADLEEIASLQIELRNWNQTSSVETSGESCPEGTDACRLSEGTVSVSFSLTWNTAGGADISFSFEADDVETTWFEAL